MLGHIVVIRGEAHRNRREHAVGIKGRPQRSSARGRATSRRTRTPASLPARITGAMGSLEVRCLEQSDYAKGVPFCLAIGCHLKLARGPSMRRRATVGIREYSSMSLHSPHPCADVFVNATCVNERVKATCSCSLASPLLATCQRLNSQVCPRPAHVSPGLSSARVN